MMDDVESHKMEMKVHALIGAVQALHWMARRYADGRSTYAPNTFNEQVRILLAMGIELHKPHFARDGMGRKFDKLTDEEALEAEGDQLQGWNRESKETAERIAGLIGENAAQKSQIDELFQQINDLRAKLASIEKVTVVT